MDPRNRVTRPVNQRPETAPQQSTATRQYVPPTTSQARNKPSRKTVLIVLAILLALATTWCALSWFRVVGPLSGVKSDKYQAVFLTNDQVYFGKISSMTGDTITIGDVYYLKQKGSTDTTKDQGQSQEVQLAKLGAGNEVHNPDNEMRINRTQVLFWENIKDDSQVVKTIKQAQ